MRFFTPFLILVSAISLDAQTPSLPPGTAQPGPPRVQMPPRDNAAIPTGTGRVRGRVVAADTGSPLRRAQVRLSNTELRINRIVSTNAEGRYEFVDLPAARYSLNVTRNGYVSLGFGQRRPFESGRPLDVAAAQTIENIDFALPRGGVISGRITDELGEPMAGVRLQAMRFQYQPTGERQLVPVFSGSFFNSVTNDLGEFRLFSLMPATYVLSAVPEDLGGMMASPGGPSVTPSSENDGHGITYYPGTINVDEAQPITVGIAQETNVSFALVPSRMTRISGVIRDSQGSPLSGAMLGLRTRTGSGGMFARALPGVGPDGGFSIANVPPGDHWIEVFPRGAEGEAAAVAITAGGRDITNLVITTTPGQTISGRVIFEGTSVSSRPTRIVVAPAEPGGPMPVRNSAESGTIDSEGRFELRGVTGRVMFRPAQAGFGPVTGWSVKSVKLGGVDITDRPLDVAHAGDLTTVEIVVTDKQSTLSGIVKSVRGEQIKDYTVAILPEALPEGTLPARFTRVVRPDQQGRFEIRDLPPGNYLAAAVDSLEQGGQWDPAFRKQIEPSAKRFRLTEGETLSLDLQLLQ
jgi:hypothetical protein